MAIVLMRGNEAVWTISLDGNFVVNRNAPEGNEANGTISLYEATMKNNEPIMLEQMN